MFPPMWPSRPSTEATSTARRTLDRPITTAVRSRLSGVGVGALDVSMGADTVGVKREAEDSSPLGSMAKRQTTSYGVADLALPGERLSTASGMARSPAATRMSLAHTTAVGERLSTSGMALSPAATRMSLAHTTAVGMTPRTSVVPRLSTAARTVGGSDLDSKLYSVASHVQCTKDASEACQEMLFGTTFGALGPAKDARDELQHEAAELIGQALRINESYLVELIRAAEEKVHVEQVKYDELDSAAVRCKGAKETTARDVQARLEDKKRCQASADEAFRAFQRAKETEAKATMEYNVALKDKAQLDDAYYKHFLILKKQQQGGLSEHEIKSHLVILHPCFTKWGLEDSLVASFGKAVRHDPETRLKWSVNSIEAVEEFFHLPMKELEETALRLKSVVEQYHREVEALQASYNQALADVEAANVAVLAAQRADEQAARELMAAEQQLAQQRGILKQVQSEVDRRKFELKQFQEGAMADYQWLLDNTSAGRYTTRSGKALALSADRAEKVKMVCRALEQCEQNGACLSMLVGAAPGSLGIDGHSRDQFQSAIVQLILRALSTREGALCSAITSGFGELGSVDFMDINSLKGVLTSEGGEEAAGKLVHEKCDTKVRSADAYLADIRGSIDSAAKSLTIAERELQAIMQSAAAIEDAYNKRFIPIRDGTLSAGQIASNVDALIPILKKIKCEECLIACFRAAAQHTPQQRGVWCKDTITEVDNMFAAPLREAQALVAAAKEKVAICKAELERAQGQLAAAQESLKIAQAECRVAKRIQSQTIALKQFRMGPLEFARSG